MHRSIRRILKSDNNNSHRVYYAVGAPFGKIINAPRDRLCVR